ncbi:MAG TPA: hypothetical protein VFJ82_06345 [Longimicrobium sp.]|nr:hypothetical protein [Longimicrobium sp.]
MIQRLVLFLTVASMAAAPAAAQQRSALDAAALSLRPALTTQASSAPPRPSRARAAGRTALHVLGGAVIGAGAGYLASQVAWSDWDKHSNSEFASRRMSFALGGGAVGAVAGLVMGRGSHVDATAPVGRAPRSALGAMVTSDELRATAATTLYDFLQGTRPSWLRGRGEGALRAGPVAAGASTGNDDPQATTVRQSQSQADQAATSPAPKVYLDGGFVGDVNQLRQMLVSETESVELLDPAAATYRFGSGHPSGAIVVTTRRH